MNRKFSDSNSALLDSTGELPAVGPVKTPENVQLQPLGVPQARLNAHFYKQAIEPRQLIDAFLRHTSPEICSLELGSVRVPGYSALSDLLAHLLAKSCNFSTLIRGLCRSPILRKRALFVGTTATEFLVAPAIENIGTLVSELKLQMQKRNCDLLVLKDIPEESPLLPHEENTQAQKLFQYCEQSSEFTVIAGKRLAYFPINFSNLDVFFASLDPARATNLRRKFESRESVDVVQLSTGDKFFYDPSVLQEIYQLYSNTHEQTQVDTEFTASSVLFSGVKQTPNYFHDLLLDQTNNGIVFLYRVQKKLVGFNLCFSHQNNLIDKYSGFTNPIARKFNLAEVSLLTNLEYACNHDLAFFVAGSLDSAALWSAGARFVHSRHAVLASNSLLQSIIKKAAEASRVEDK